MWGFIGLFQGTQSQGQGTERDRRHGRLGMGSGAQAAYEVPKG